MATRRSHAAGGRPSRVATGLGSETGERDVMRLFLTACARHGNHCGARGCSWMMVIPASLTKGPAT